MATLPGTPSESGQVPSSWIGTRFHRSTEPAGTAAQGGELTASSSPHCTGGAWPRLGELELRPNPSGFALHAAEIFFVAFIFTQIPRMQRQAGKQELKANRKKAGSLDFYF